MSLVFFDLNNFIDTIFCREPQPPCTFSIKFKSIPITDRNKILFKILLIGAKKKFGNDITIDTIQTYQVNILNNYLQSIGYKVNYEIVHENRYKIWFDQIKVVTYCNGAKVITKIE